MKNLPRILFLTGALLLLLVFAFPLWQITLFAPQYPDGITMYIWINKISGNGDGILQNVNILNHYIGMAPIEPESIPELTYFPYIVGAMVAAGLILFFVNRPGGFLIWGFVLMVLGALGIYDFYLWEYDYGHNLAPDAPIKIPGMVYQPPLFGRKMLLNFEAFSYPHWGSVFLGLAIILALAAFWLAYRKRKNMAVKAPVVAVLAVMMMSCSTEPVPIPYGEANCDHCQMTIVDRKFGSELVTDKGKIYMFDAIECMLQFQSNHPDTRWKDVLVTALDNPTDLTEADQAWYLRSEALQSPMSLNLSAFSSETKAREYSTELGGQVYSWTELKAVSGDFRPGVYNQTTQ